MKLYIRATVGACAACGGCVTDRLFTHAACQLLREVSSSSCISLNKVGLKTQLNTRTLQYRSRILRFFNNNKNLVKKNNGFNQQNP